MSRIVLVIPAGTSAALLGGVVGTFTSDASVDFGETTHDDLAHLFAQAPASEVEKVPFMGLLEHTEGGRVIKYTPQGNRVQSVEEERFDDVRAAVEEGLEEIDTQQVQDETEQDRQADLISEKVARSTDAITSPSEAAEAAAVDQEPAPPAQDPTQEAGSSSPEAPGGGGAPQGGSPGTGSESSPNGSPDPETLASPGGTPAKVFSDEEAKALVEG